MPPVKKFPIEGASWLEQVFDMVSARGADQQALTLYIPDTVVFRYQRPAALFTNDAIEEHQVSCRDELSDLSADALYQRFAGKKDAPENVSAIYVYNDRQGHDAEERDEASQDAHNMVVEYMNAPQLRHFLQHRPKENNGILQRFLPSKGAFHTTIRVMWTPRTCHVETRTNRHKMGDLKLSVTDRYSTFDGGPHLSISHSLKDGLFYKNIKNAADSIVKHLETLIPRPYQVWETVMYFKYCAPDRGTQREKSGISFLWCSSLRVFKDELLDLRRLDEFWTSDLKTEVMVNKEAPEKELKVMRCPITGKPYADGTGTEVKVSTIVKYLSILGDSHPHSSETLKLKQEAADLDEHAGSKDTIGGRGNAKNAGGDAAIREMISEMMQKKTAAREVCDLIKRALFGNPDAADAAKIRAIFNHETFLHQTIAVSEDTALDSALVVERDSFSTKSNSTPSNDATQLLARRGRKHMKKAGAVALMPASVVEVKSIVVGPNMGRGGNSMRLRASTSKSPLGHGDSLGGMLSQGTTSKSGGSNRANLSEPSHFSSHRKPVDLELGKSRILSFRRLKYLPMGAPAMKGRVHQEVPESLEKVSGEDGQVYQDQSREVCESRLKSGNEDGNGLYSKLKISRGCDKQGPTDGTLDSSTLDDSIGLADARSKVLGQYAAFDRGSAQVEGIAGRIPPLQPEQNGSAPTLDSRSRPPPIHLDHEAVSVPLPSATRMSPPLRVDADTGPRRDRPRSDYNPTVLGEGMMSSSRALRPVSAQINAAPSRREHGTVDKGSSMKNFKVLDAEWSNRMRPRQIRSAAPHVKERLTEMSMAESNRPNRLPSANARQLPVARYISSGDRRERAAGSAAASTRVSSAASASAKERRPTRGAGGHPDWSDGDLIEDDDEDDWDDGLEMDLPSTHVRLKRDQELRSSRDAERTLRRSGESRPTNSLPLCLQWGVDDKLRAKVLQQYAFHAPM